MPWFLAFLVVCVTGACSLAENNSTGERTAEDSSAHADSLRQAIEGLLTIPGRFEGTAHSGWTFRPSSPLFLTIERFGDRAVTDLVGCMDDVRPASATVNGRPVLMGVMCYEALRRFVYYEHWDSRIEGYSTDWAGYVVPTAGPTELRRAKRLWLEVARDTAYRIA